MADTSTRTLSAELEKELQSAPTTHQGLLEWVREVAALTQPAHIYWVDGSQEEYDRLQEEMKTSMNPPPLRTGPRLEELYRQVHDQQTSHVTPRDKLVNIDFEIPYCTCSGLKVEYLKVEEPQLQYQSFPWVRYKTVSDEEYAYIV